MTRLHLLPASGGLAIVLASVWYAANLISSSPAPTDSVAAPTASLDALTQPLPVAQNGDNAVTAPTSGTTLPRKSAVVAPPKANAHHARIVSPKTASITVASATTESASPAGASLTPAADATDMQTAMLPSQELVRDDLGLVPASPQPAGAKRNVTVPKRWLNDLSGFQVEIKTSERARPRSCLEDRNTCAREPAPQDITLAGVVVRTNRASSQEDSLLAGRVRNGHYLDKTPAVYLE